MPTPAADAYCLLEVYQALSREPASFSLSEDLARSLQPGCSERPGAREPPRLQEASALPWQVGEAPPGPLHKSSQGGGPDGEGGLGGEQSPVSVLEEEGSHRSPVSGLDVLPPRSRAVSRVNHVAPEPRCIVRRAPTPGNVWRPCLGPVRAISHHFVNVSVCRVLRGGHTARDSLSKG